MGNPATTKPSPTLAIDQPSKVAEVALRLFLEHGFDATPMSLVAKHTGLTKAGVYHHFESKEHLLYLVHKSHIDSLLLPLTRRPRCRIQRNGCASFLVTMRCF